MTTASRTNLASLIGLIVAISMVSIDQTIVALTGPTIEADLGITHDEMQWVVNVYLISTAAFFLLGGRLADIIGHKRMAIIGIAGFGLASLLCGLAPDGAVAATWLISARALQGLAGAIMFPAAIGIVVASFARETRARAMAVFFGITGAMTALGPIAGGYLSVWTWRAVFWVNVPLAVTGFLIVLLAAPRSERHPQRVDWFGAGVIALAFGLIVFGLQQAGVWGWGNVIVVAAIVLGLALLVLFVFMQGRVQSPLVNLAVFRDRGFVLANLALLFASIAFVSTFFFLSVYGQVSLRLTALDTGLLFLKFFLGFVVASQLGAQLFDRIGGRGVLIIGGTLGAAGFTWLAYAVTRIPDDASAFWNPQSGPIALAGAGIGFMLSAASTDAVNRAIGAAYGEVTAISQTMRNLGGALGMALFSSIVTRALSDELAVSFQALGAPASAAPAAVSAIGGTVGDADAAFSPLSAAARAQFAHAIQQGYAEAVSYAFVGSAIAMGLVLVLGLLYPGVRATVTRSVPTKVKSV